MNISQPIAQPGTYLHCPFIVNLQFIEIAIQKRTDELLTIFSQQNLTSIPLTWRGIELPQSPVAPYYSFPPPFSTGASISYFGLCARSISFEKRGFFNVVYVAFFDTFSINPGDD